MTEPIRQVWQDGKREQKVADYLAREYNWEFYPTPRYYFVDYLVNKNKPNGYANYIGGLEIKWMNRPADSEVKFPFQKLQRMWMTEPLDDNPDAFNPIRVMGKHAGGIPQLLGLDPDTPAPRQIERGLDYIYYRYGTPCDAWSHWKRNGNY